MGLELLQQYLSIATNTFWVICLNTYQPLSITPYLWVFLQFFQNWNGKNKMTNKGKCVLVQQVNTKASIRIHRHWLEIQMNKEEQKVIARQTEKRDFWVRKEPHHRTTIWNQEETSKVQNLSLRSHTAPAILTCHPNLTKWNRKQELRGLNRRQSHTHFGDLWRACW